jgi:dihydrofolate reductase
MINIIVAFCKNRGIGIKNTLPWNLHNDLKRFQALTTNQSVIMGRKTWDSLPIKPLSRRENIVVSNTMKEHMIFPKCSVQTNLKDAIENSKNRGFKQTWIIGGSSLYKEALEENYVNNIFATEIEGDYMCDVFFPEIPDNFKITASSEWYTYKFTDYRYVQYKNENTVNI